MMKRALVFPHQNCLLFHQNVLVADIFVDLISTRQLLSRCDLGNFNETSETGAQQSRIECTLVKQSEFYSTWFRLGFRSVFGTMCVTHIYWRSITAVREIVPKSRIIQDSRAANCLRMHRSCSTEWSTPTHISIYNPGPVKLLITASFDFMNWDGVAERWRGWMAGWQSPRARSIKLLNE